MESPPNRSGNGDDDDEPDVVVVIVTHVAKCGWESRHRYRRVRQRGVRLGLVSGVGDRVDLIHGRGAEGIEVGLYQLPCRMPIGRNENRCSLLEFVPGQHPGKYKDFSSDRRSAARPLAAPTLTRPLSRSRNATTSAPVGAGGLRQTDRAPELAGDSRVRRGRAAGRRCSPATCSRAEPEIRH
jgi:hypothetical protein